MAHNDLMPRMVNVKDATKLDYLRFILSASLLVFSCVVTCYAILEQKTSMWKIVPGWSSLLIFILALFLLGIMEGLQTADSTGGAQETGS